MSDYSDIGKQNLEVLEGADAFVDWMYSEVKPFLKGNILEVGSGVGTFSTRLVRDFKANKLIFSDIDESYIKDLKDKFGNLENVSCIKFNLNNPEDLKNIRQTCDSAFALNVLEHVKDDVLALNLVYNALAPNGMFIIIVPAHKFLYNCIDSSIGHYRRYTREDFLNKVAQTRFRIKHISYFNFLSILGWYINGNLLKKSVINSNAMGFFNKLVPFVRLFERVVLRKKLGLSLVVVLEKQVEQEQ